MAWVQVHYDEFIIDGGNKNLQAHTPTAADPADLFATTGWTRLAGHTSTTVDDASNSLSHPYSNSANAVVTACTFPTAEATRHMVKSTRSNSKVGMFCGGLANGAGYGAYSKDNNVYIVRISSSGVVTQIKSAFYSHSYGEQFTFIYTGTGYMAIQGGTSNHIIGVTDTTYTGGVKFGVWSRRTQNSGALDNFEGWVEDGYLVGNPVVISSQPSDIRLNGGESINKDFTSHVTNSDPYTFAIVAGTLPAGLSLSTGGVLTGAPTSFDTQLGIEIEVTDSGSDTVTFDPIDIVVDPDVWGMAGADIPVGSFFYANLQLPGDNDKYYKADITATPSSGNFQSFADGSYFLTDAAEGSYTIEYDLYENGVNVLSDVHTINIQSSNQQEDATGNISGPTGTAATTSKASNVTGNISGQTGVESTTVKVSTVTGNISGQTGVESTTVKVSTTTGNISGQTGVESTTVKVSTTTGNISGQTGVESTTVKASTTTGNISGSGTITTTVPEEASDINYLITENSSDTSNTIPETGNYDSVWDAPTIEGTGISYSNSVFTLADAGYYLVMASDLFNAPNTSATDRVMLQSRLILDDAEYTAGFGNTYLRRDVSYKGAITSLGIVKTTSSDSELKLRYFRTDNSGGFDDVVRVANEGHMTILKLDSSWDYGRYTLSTQATGTDSTWFTVAFDTSLDTDVNLANISTTGRYLVTYSYKTEGFDTSNRSDRKARLTRNGSNIPGTNTYSFLRGIDGTVEGALSYAGIIELTAGDALNMQVMADGAPTGDYTDLNLQIVKLPDTVETFIVNSVGGDINTVAPTNFDWDSTTQIDSSAFSHTPGNPNVDVNNPGDYLILANQSQDGSTVERAAPSLKLGVNSAVDSATSTSYIRGTGDSYDTALTVATVLSNLSANDSIYAVNEATSSSTSSIEADQAVMSGVRLSSMFGAPNANSNTTSSIQGSGNLTSNTSKTSEVSVDISGNGSITINVNETSNSATGISGAGNLDVTVTKSSGAASTTTGTGSLDSETTKQVDTSTTLTGGGEIQTVTGNVTVRVSSITGAGNIVSSANKESTVQVEISGTGTTTAETAGSGTVVTGISGSGNSIATTNKQGLISVSISEEGNLVSTHTVDRETTSSVSGGGYVVTLVNGEVPPTNIQYLGLTVKVQTTNIAITVEIGE